MCVKQIGNEQKAQGGGDLGHLSMEPDHEPAPQLRVVFRKFESVVDAGRSYQDALFADCHFSQRTNVVPTLSQAIVPSIPAAQLANISQGSVPKRQDVVVPRQHSEAFYGGPIFIFASDFYGGSRHWMRYCIGSPRSFG
jgi:hypothetical protein